MEIHLTKNFIAHPVLWIIPIVALGFMVLTRVCMNKKYEFRTFIWSALTIDGMMGAVGASIYPDMLPATNDPGLSLTISASRLTRGWMPGTPLIYQGWACKQCRGKVRFDEDGY